jgi:peptidoglycan hydrolase CwlO-like protein
MSWAPIWQRVDSLQKKNQELERKIELIMAAIDDLKAGQAALDKAVQDTISYLQSLAGSISGGVSAADAETIAADLTAKAAALEAAIAPAPATPAPAETHSA